MAIFGRVYSSVLGLIDPVVVPAANRRFARTVHRDPDRLRREVEASVERCVAYFEGAGSTDLAALFLLGRLFRTAAVPSLDFIEDRIAAFARQSDDPHLRLLDPAHHWVPGTAIPGEYAHPVLRLMIRCLYADRTHDVDACLTDLAVISDGGGYGTTHVAVGALILREFAGLRQSEVDSILRDTPGVLVRAQRRERAGDLFAERIAALQWMGRGDLVDPAWIVRLLRAQQASGGWSAGPSLRSAKPNQHTSALAAVALGQWMTGVSTFWRVKNEG